MNSHSEWLSSTVSAVRERMVKQLQAGSLDPDARRGMEAALKELDVMWEELQGQAQMLTRESERYAEFFEYAPDAYFITDAGGGVREVNQAALELLQAARDDVVGRPLSDYIVGLVLGPRRPTTWNTRLQTAGGAALEVALTVRAIALRKSGICSLCWLVRPIT